jgi:hypothetical protein
VTNVTMVQNATDTGVQRMMRESEWSKVLLASVTVVQMANFTKA